MKEEPNWEENTDALYPEAVKVVKEHNKGSTSLLQRKLRIGYSRACWLMDMLEDRGVITPIDPAHPSKPREIINP